MSVQQILTEPQAWRPPSVPEYLRPVLGQLLSGATDNAASHRLNMSPRTFSRRVAELLELLGVQTRFQGGFEIARYARSRDHSRLLVPTVDGATPVPTLRPVVPVPVAWSRPIGRLPVRDLLP